MLQKQQKPKVTICGKPKETVNVVLLIIKLAIVITIVKKLNSKCVFHIKYVFGNMPGGHIRS